MSRNSDSNTWSSTGVKSSYSSLGSNSGSNNMVMSSRPDPWSNSSSSREMETTVWSRPPQPPADKYVHKFLNIYYNNFLNLILFMF